ncbi:5938_t:CDS:2, partial [Scutellospora calospora]
IRLKFGTFPLIASYARRLWQQIKQVNTDENPNPYTASYSIDKLEGLAKVYRFYLSNPVEQLRHTQTTEITSDIIENIVETVFKEFEEILIEEDEDIEISSPTENLYSDEQDLDLKFSEIESDDNDIQEIEYDVDEIVAAQLDYSSN